MSFSSKLNLLRFVQRPLSSSAASKIAEFRKTTQTPGKAIVPALSDTAHKKKTAERLRLMPFNRRVDNSTFYELLGVQSTADASSIKSAYYKLAKQLHPDAKTQGSATDNAARRKFVELNIAYETLADSMKRSAYDQQIQAKQKHGLMGRSPERVDTFTLHAEPPGQAVSRQPPDIYLDLTFSEAVCGVEKTVSMSHTAPCPACRITHSGAPRKTQQSVLCPLCKGTGRHNHSANTALASRADGVCKMCLGARYKTSTVCSECSDRGTVTTELTVPVQVPAGSTSNDTLAICHPQTGRPMHISLRIRDSDLFRRDGFDVHTTVRIPFTLAILGGPLAVPGVYGGEVHTKLQPGTQADTQIRLLGKGIRRESPTPTQQNTSFGDHILTLKVMIPQQVSERQRTLLASFVTAENATPSQAQTNYAHQHQRGGAGQPDGQQAQAAAPNDAAASATSTALPMRRNWASRLSTTAKTLMVGA